MAGFRQGIATLWEFPAPSSEQLTVNVACNSAPFAWLCFLSVVSSCSGLALLAVVDGDESTASTIKELGRLDADTLPLTQPARSPCPSEAENPEIQVLGVRNV